jgi:leader peptidase (prepilin peptidase) / N-methyltransferase
MTWLTVTAGALFGTIFGSFLNVVVYRAPRDLSVVRPGSFCPSCKTEIANRDNVPVVSWIWLRGRCRHCREPISARYPLVEAATGAVFAALGATVRPLWGVPGWWAMVASIGVVAVVEADAESCPAAVPLIGTAIGGIALGAAAVLTGHLDPIPNAALGLGSGVLFSLGLARSATLRHLLGAGAIGAIPAWGTCLGWLGALPSVVGVGVGLVFVVALAPVASGKGHRWTHVPLATALAAGLVGALLAGGLSS